MKFRFTIDDIAAARDAGAIDVVTFERLSQFLASRQAAVAEATSQAPRYDVVNLLWYAGALIVLTAMGMFSTTAFGLWGDKALLATAIVYSVLFALAGAYLWRKRELHTPGGLLIACAVGMTPLAIFALQSMFGVNPTGEARPYGDFYVWIKSSWLPMELGTIAAALRRPARLPFPIPCHDHRLFAVVHVDGSDALADGRPRIFMGSAREREHVFRPRRACRRLARRS